MDLNLLKKEFLEIYGENEKEIRVYFAPGRVNLIGEHTDYNGGLVLPCAISFGTYLLVRKPDFPIISFHSSGFDYSAKVPTGKHYANIHKHWVNYPLGIIEMMAEKGKYVDGMELYFAGNIPSGAGLSSSASIEMATAFAINDLMQWDFSMRDLINISKQAENEFIGVNCGIMDMFAIGLAEEAHALFLDCGTLQYQNVPLDLQDYRLVIMNTNRKRGLAGSKYNERVEECRLAVDSISRFKRIKNLGQLNMNEFLKYKSLISDEIIQKRALHVVSEDQRVKDSVEALRNSDLKAFGELMDQSHASLRDNYEVTGLELDSIVAAARQQEGVIGARMTGAGFGGCAIALVNKNFVDEFLRNTEMRYFSKTGIRPEFYLPQTGGGVRRLE